MLDTPSVIARSQKRRSALLQPGTLLSSTIVRHPPEGFGTSPRAVGLIALDSGEHVLAPLIGETHLIGQRLMPRMRLTRVNAEGLRVYEVAFEQAIEVTAPTERREFPGYVLALTGPSGVGKSSVRKLLTTVLSEIAVNVPILTTRQAKRGDDGEYLYVDKAEFLAMRDRGEIIASTRIPSTTEERWYGYRAADIEEIWATGKVPVVITETHLLQSLARHYGRRSILSCGLLPPGSSRRARLSQLLHRLRTRGRDSEQSIRDRIRNASRDLRFFEERTDLFDHLLVNENVEAVVDLLSGHLKKNEAIG